MKQFATCHSHPASLDSASTPKAFAKREVELGSPALVCTDHGTLQAAHEIYELGKKHKLTPVVGLEAYVRDDNCPILQKLGVQRTETVPRGVDKEEWRRRYPQGTYLDYLKYLHCTLHFADYPAYLCAVKLLSKADLRAEQHGSERKPLFDWGDLEELAAHNVTATSSCLIGMVQRHLMAQNDPVGATAYFERMHHLFGDRFYVEVFPHRCTHNWTKAVFVDVQADGGKKTLQFRWDKKLMTDRGEIYAEALADGFDPKKDGRLLQHSHYRKWYEYEEGPRVIMGARKVEEFVENECRPWTRNSDLQEGCNRFVLALAAQHKVPVLIGDDCLAAGTLVRTLDGYMPVEAVQPGQAVLSHEGHWRRVEATRGFFTDKPFVTLNAGGLPVTLTSDHRVWARVAQRYKDSVYPLGHREAEPQWIAANVLQAGDLVFVPKPPMTPEGATSFEFQLLGYVNHRWRFATDDTEVVVTNHLTGETVRFKSTLTLSEADAWLLGFFVGDGNAHNNVTSFVADLETYDAEVRPRVIALAERLGMSWDEKRLPGHAVVRIINTALAQFFRKEFYKEKVKTVPMWVRTAAPGFQDAVAAGLLYADGSACRAGQTTRYSLSMTSLDAVAYVRELALQRGVYCSLGERRTAGSTKILYTVNLPPEIANIWRLWGPLPPQRKAVRWLEEPQGYWVRVRSVATAPSTLVYDLQVADDYSFATSSFAVHNSHFANPDEKIVQDVRLSQGGDWRFHNSYHRQSSQEALAHFQATLGTSEQEFEGWVETSHAWVERFKGFRFDTTPSLPNKFYPTDVLGHTKALIEKHGRMDKTDPVRVRRLKAEVDLLHRLSLETIKSSLLPYFFIDEEVCHLFETKGLLTGPGRGSAAGLLLAYLEGITHVDPLRYGLSMERFMTPDRIRSGKLPDIDQDLPKKWREPLLLDPEHGWLRQRFGDHVAQISVDTTLKLKNAVLDVTRARHRHIPDHVQGWTKKFEKPPQGVNDYNFVLGYKGEDGSWVQGSIETDKALQAYIEWDPDGWEIVKKCLGLARQKGRHACAMAIMNEPVTNRIPLTTVSGVRVTSFTAGAVEAVGGLKMDFLGLGALDDIGDAIQLIQARHARDEVLHRYQIVEHEEPLVGWSGIGTKARPNRFSIILDGRRVPAQRLVPMGDTLLDIWDLPEDQAVFADVATGNTETVFQFNTPGAVKWLTHFGCRRPDGNYAIDSIEAMAAFTALDRPGPLNILVRNPEEPDQTHNMLVEYARRARGAVGSQDVLPIMDELVPETYGVMVYQEQLQRVYQSLTGCSGPEAEEFRTNVAKKKKEKVDAAYPAFIERAGAKLGEENAKKLWGFIETWGQYGFNKSHSVCYAVIGYACAYLKHHYPLEWWCAVLRNAKKEEINDKFWPHVGHLVLLPDVQYSGAQWTIEGDKLRAPLTLVQGIGEAAHAQLVGGAPYTSLDDFVAKIKTYRDAGAKLEERKKKKKKGQTEDEYETVRVLGRSALNRGTVHTLVVAGAMTSLFPPGAVDGQCMDLFDAALAAVFGKAKGKKTEYPRLDPLGRYQARKKVLRAWGADLRPLVQGAGLPDFLVVYDGKRMRMRYRGWDRDRRREVTMEDPVIGLERLAALDASDKLPDGGWRCGVLAYVEEAEDLIYAKKTKRARKLLLDVGGAKYHLVHWPDFEGVLPDHVAQCKTGSVVAALLVKREAGKEFAIRELRVIRGPLAEKEQDTDGNEHEKPAGTD